MLYKKQFIFASIFSLTFLTCFLCVHGSQQHTNTVVCSTSSSESTSYGAVSSMQNTQIAPSHKQKAQALSCMLQAFLEIEEQQQDDLDLFTQGVSYEENLKLEAAEQCFEEARSNGDLSASHYLPEFYEKHEKEISNARQKRACSLRLIAQSLDGDIDASACRQLGRCYEEGDGVEKNIAEAFKWYQKAAHGRDGIACYLVGQCYEQGTCGFAFNAEEAFKYYDLAAAWLPENPSWVKKIYTKLAYCYQNGWGTARDSKKASSHLKTANKAAYLEIHQ